MRRQRPKHRSGAGYVRRPELSHPACPLGARPQSSGLHHGARDRGSTFPLILGFFLIALLVTAGAVALGDAYVQQRGLQSVCDGAAAAAAASGVDLERNLAPGTGTAVPFAEATVDRAVGTYLARDPERSDVGITAQSSADARTLTLRCTETRKIAFGAMFGRADGVRHVVESTVRAPVS